MYLVEQLFSFVCIADADALSGEILQQHAVVDIAAGEHGLLAVLEALVLYQLYAVAVVYQRISGYAGLLLIRLTEPSVYHKSLAVGANRCLAFNGANGHVTVYNTSRSRVYTEFFEYLFANMFFVRQREIRAFGLAVRDG